MGNREFAVKLMSQAVDAAIDKTKPSNLQTAYQLFASACVADPTFGDGHYQYANNNFDLKQYPAAIAAYKRALQCDLEPKTKARLLVNLGWSYHLSGDTERAYEATLKAGEIDDELVHYWLHRSVLEGLFGDSKQSITSAECAIALAQKEQDEFDAGFVEYGAVNDTPTTRSMVVSRQLLETRIALAFALLFAGEYKRGFELFELRFEWRLHSFLQFPYPKWLGEPDKTVFLVADQGLGDTLSFARFTEMACKRARYVHAYIQPELMRTFMHSLSHVPNLNLIPSGAAYPQADAWTTFVSLPFALGLSDDEVRDTPQIKPPSLVLPSTWLVPDVKMHIGIQWAGSPLNDIDKYRNIPVEQFLSLYDVPGIQLYGLQVGERAKELHERGCVSLIRDLSPYISDIASTGALLKHLDLVICCESALGHICALENKEAWLPYSWLGRDWRAGLLGEKKLWAPKHHFFCQDSSNDWGVVFDEMAGALRERMNESDRTSARRSKVA